jgi:hypothetical protein
VIEVNTLANEYVIKEGQIVFDFVCGLPNAEDFGISALPIWVTTIWPVEKTDRGFKVKFGTPCPKDGGLLYLSLYTPKKMLKK